jgi:hypothetical protein
VIRDDRLAPPIGNAAANRAPAIPVGVGWPPPWVNPATAGCFAITALPGLDNLEAGFCGFFAPPVVFLFDADFVAICSYIPSAYPFFGPKRYSIHLRDCRDGRNCHLCGCSYLRHN